MSEEERWIQITPSCAGLEDELIAVVFTNPQSPFAHQGIAHILYCGHCGLNLTNQAGLAWEHFEFEGPAILGGPIAIALKRATTYHGATLGALTHLSSRQYIADWQEVIEQYMAQAGNETWGQRARRSAKFP